MHTSIFELDSTLMAKTFFFFPTSQVLYIYTCTFPRPGSTWWESTTHCNGTPKWQSQNCLFLLKLNNKLTRQTSKNFGSHETTRRKQSGIIIVKDLPFSENLQLLLSPHNKVSNHARAMYQKFS